MSGRKMPLVEFIEYLSNKKGITEAEVMDMLPTPPPKEIVVIDFLSEDQLVKSEDYSSIEVKTNEE